MKLIQKCLMKFVVLFLVIKIFTNKWRIWQSKNKDPATAVVTIFALWKKNHCTRQSCRSDINEKNSKLLFIIFFFNSTSVGTLNPCLWFYNFLKYQLFPCLYLCNEIFNKKSIKFYISIRHNFEFDKARFRKFYMIFIVVLK